MGWGLRLQRGRELVFPTASLSRLCPQAPSHAADLPILKLCLTSDVQNRKVLSSVLLLATKLSLQEPQVTNRFFKKKQSQERICEARFASLSDVTDTWQGGHGQKSRGGVVPRGRGCLHLLSTHYTGLAQAQGPDALLGAAPYGEGP